MAPYIVCIEGNIGAGKSTLLDELETRNYTVFREQVEGNADVSNDWLWVLNNCYKNPARWACSLQIAILKSMASQKDQIDKIKQPVVFIERCPVSTIVFTNMWRNNECLTEGEYNLIGGIYNTFSWIPNLTLMLTTPAQECFQRVLGRGRECESGLTFDYITRVGAEYDKVYTNRQYVPLDYSGNVAEVADRTIRLLSELGVPLKH